MRERKQIFITNNFKETQRLGMDLVTRCHLDKGATLTAIVIALYGELGSGKTTFVQGLAKGLRIKRRIISPTFNIIKKYNLKTSASVKTVFLVEVAKKAESADKQNSKRNTFLHIDLYRIEGQKDLEGLGIEEILNNHQNIVVVEWAERLGKLLPEKRIDINFEYLRGENKRKIAIKIKFQKAKIKV